VSELIKAGFETLTNAGFSPKSPISNAFRTKAFATSFIEAASVYALSISTPPNHGDYTRPRIVTQQTAKRWKKIARGNSGRQFAKKWIEENEKG